MTRPATSIVAATAAFVIAGCNSAESELVGTYTGVAEYSQESLEEIRAAAVRLGASPDELLSDLPSSLTLELRQTRTFVMTIGRGEETSRLAGEWDLSRDESELTLKNTRTAGFDFSTESGFSDDRFFDQIFTVSQDGNSFSMSQEELEVTVTVTFSRN